MERTCVCLIRRRGRGSDLYAALEIWTDMGIHMHACDAPPPPRFCVVFFFLFRCVTGNWCDIWLTIKCVYIQLIIEFVANLWVSRVLSFYPPPPPNKVGDPWVSDGKVGKLQLLRSGANIAVNSTSEVWSWIKALSGCIEINDKTRGTPMRINSISIERHYLNNGVINLWNNLKRVILNNELKPHCSILELIL